MEVLVIGNKPYHKIPMSGLIDSFSYNVRCNMSLPNKNNGTKTFSLGLCNHLYDNLIKSPISIREFKKIYHSYKTTSIDEFFQKFDKKIYENIYFAKHNKDKSNSLLRSYGSPYRFSKQPRTGFTIVFDNLMNGNDVYVFGFSIKNEERISYYVESEFESPVHEMKDEINILRWLHKNNKIDATLCMLVDTDIPTLDCEGGLRPNLKTLNKIVEMFGRCRLINYEIMKEDSMLESLKNFNIEIGETIDILKK